MMVGPGELKNVVLKLAKVNFTGDYNPPFDLTDPNMSYGYRFLRGNTAAPANPEKVPQAQRGLAGQQGGRFRAEHSAR